MTIRYLLDTSVLSEPVAKSPNPKVVRKLQRLGDRCALAAPNWHELVYGCRRLPDGKRRAALETYLVDVVQASFPMLPYDQAAAARHAEERARLDERGLSSPVVDGQIAAIALVHGLTLVTRNRKDFVRYESLRVEDWASS